MNLDIEKLKAQLKVDEDLRLKPYRDTVGKLTIGVGRNLDDVGITAGEADFLLNNDIQRVVVELHGAFPWWTKMSEPRQRALVNMCFNLGIARLSGFRHMLAAMEQGDFELAANEARDSKWSHQVGDGPGGRDDRADRIIAMIRNG